MLDKLKEFQEKGKPVYVPNGKEILLKGWELDNDFMLNPDYVPPPPPPEEKIEPIQLRCGRCGVEVKDSSNKAIEFKGGAMRNIICCARCINYG